MYDTIIIGGGAAGLFAAAHLTEGENLLLEGTKKLGQKILISGGGMCNITNMDEVDEFLSHFGDKKRINFLKPSLLNLSTEKTRNYLENIGMELSIRDDGKVFPKTLKAQTVINSLQTEITHNGIRIKYNAKVTTINVTDNGFVVKTSTETYKCKKILVASGGKSFPETGSDGSLYKILQNIGCSIVEPTPALVGLKITNYPFKTIAGNAVRGCNIDLFRNDEPKRIMTAQGDLLFTHQGISGPVILNNSRSIEINDKLLISLVPCSNKEEKRTNLLSTMNNSAKTTVKRFLKEEGLTASMVDLLARRMTLQLDCPVKSLNKKIKNSIIDNLLNFPLNVSSKIGFNGAMVTAGGVDIKEIDRKTMQSRIIPNLYFAGEIIDIDGDTGGYNIQAAFSTAMLAACNIVKQS